MYNEGRVTSRAIGIPTNRLASTSLQHEGLTTARGASRPELNTSNEKHSHWNHQRKRKGKWHENSFGEKSSRKATNLPSHTYNSYSFDRFDSLGSSVRPFASPTKKEKQKQEHFSLLLPVCVQQHPRTRRVKEKIGLGEDKRWVGG